MKRRSFLKFMGALPLSQLLLNMEGLLNKFSAKKPVMSGIASLDEIKGGFNPGELCILAGRPSMGKTAVALNFARNICCNTDKSVAIYSLEMAKEQVMMRMLALDSGVSTWKIRSGKLSDLEFKKLIASGAELSEYKFFINDSYGASPLHINQLITRGSRLSKDSKKPDVIIVDYLQLMKSDKVSTSREQEVTSILCGLKQLAKEHQVSVIVLSQLHRSVDRADYRRPDLSDLLKMYPDISSSVDSAILISRESYYDPACANTYSSPMEFHVNKNLAQSVGNASAWWRPECGEVG